MLKQSNGALILTYTQKSGLTCFKGLDVKFNCCTVMISLLYQCECGHACWEYLHDYLPSLLLILEIEAKL